MSIDFYRAQPAPSPAFAFPLTVAALPLLDAALAAIRRLARGKSVLYGDRRHASDLMAARGWSALGILATLSAVTALLCAIGMNAVRQPSARAWILAAIAVSALVVAGIRLGSLQVGTATNRDVREENAAWR